MRVLIREGSVSKDLDALQPVLTEATSAYLCLAPTTAIRSTSASTGISTT